MSKNNIRKLKCSGECVEDNVKFLHPLSFQKQLHKDKKNKLCPTNSFLKWKE